MTRLWIQALPMLPFLVPCLAIESDFSFYPENSRGCLDQASSKARCSGETVTDLNSCLCGNHGDFVINSAKCLGKNDMADVGAVYTTMSKACDDTQTGLAVSEDDFKAAAEKAASVTTSSSTSTHSATKTATHTSTATSSHTSSHTSTHTTASNGGAPHGGVSKGTVAGIAVGSAAGAIAVVSAIIFFILRRRNQSNRLHDAVLGARQHHESSGYSPVDQSVGYGHDAERKSGWGAASSTGTRSSYMPSHSPDQTVSAASPGLYSNYGSPEPQHLERQSAAELGNETGLRPGNLFEMGPGR